MNNFKVDASVYYRAHCKKVFDSPYKTKNDNLLNLTAREDSRMTTAFNMLFNYLPDALVPYMQLAANVDPDIYSNMETLSDVNLFSKVKFEKINETRLSSVCRLSSSNPDELVKDLLEASESPATLVDRLINRRNTNLLCALENQMQINLFPSVIGPADDVSKRKTLAYMMVKLGSTKHLIHKVTGVGSKILKDLYQEVSSDFSRPIRRYKANDDSSFGLSHLLKVCCSRHFSNQIMLMISLYTICSRILLNKLPTANHFDQEDISEKLSLPLAIGVYKSCYDMYRNYHKLYPEKNLTTMEFAFFDDFFTALEIYTSKLAEVVACEDCHTPYLNLYGKRGCKTPLLSSENEDLFSVKKLTICPNCGCEFDYSLYD